MLVHDPDESAQLAAPWPDPPCARCGLYHHGLEVSCEELIEKHTGLPGYTPQLVASRAAEGK